MRDRIERLIRLFYSPDDSGTPAFGVDGDVEVMGGEDDGETQSDEGGEEAPAEDSESDAAPPPARAKARAPREERFQEEEEPDAEARAEGEEEPEEEPEQDDTAVFEGRPTLTDIKTKYPKLFKEFPDLREVLFRENEFSKRFGTVEEADEAATKTANYNVLEAALLSGDSSPIIEQLSQNAPESLNQVVDNFLPTLLKHSQDLYLRATMPIIEQFLFTAFEHGKATGDANLMRSAQHASNFMFGKPDIRDPARRALNRGPHPAEQKLEEERKQWADTRFKEASSEVSAEVDTELEAEILKGLDPDGKLSQRQRANLIRDIKDEIDARLSKDEAFRRQMRALWVKASTANYPKDQRASIKSAFLARAKTLVPPVRSKLKAEWFGKAEKGRPANGKPEAKEEVAPQRKRFVAESGRAAATSGPKRPPSPREVDWQKTSDMDLIEGRFTRKR